MEVNKPGMQTWSYKDSCDPQVTHVTRWNVVDALGDGHCIEGSISMEGDYVVFRRNCLPELPGPFWEIVAVFHAPIVVMQQTDAVD